MISFDGSDDGNDDSDDSSQQQSTPATNPLSFSILDNRQRDLFPLGLVDPSNMELRSPVGDMLGDSWTTFEAIRILKTGSPEFSLWPNPDSVYVGSVAAIAGWVMSVGTGLLIAGPAGAFAAMDAADMLGGALFELGFDANEAKEIGELKGSAVTSLLRNFDSFEQTLMETPGPLPSPTPNMPMQENVPKIDSATESTIPGNWLTVP